MLKLSQADALNQFEQLVRSRSRDRTMVALIVDSPWLPGFAGVSTTDFYFSHEVWLETYQKAASELDGAVLIPGAWFELGMAAEPTGWGTPIRWSKNQPPDVGRFPGDLESLATRPVPNPETDGMMPLILHNYEWYGTELADLGIPARIAAARGPLAVAGHLHGINELMMASQLNRNTCLKVIEKTTELCIRWLDCQLERMNEPLGVLVLDDIVGMMGPNDAAELATPYLKRIFDQFPDMLHLFHNDTPNAKVLPALVDVGIDVFNFSHKISLPDARTALGDDIVLMGNLPPLDLLVNGDPTGTAAETRQLLAEGVDAAPVLVSPGGGVSPGTQLGNLQAILATVGQGTLSESNDAANS